MSHSHVRRSAAPFDRQPTRLAPNSRRTPDFSSREEFASFCGSYPTRPEHEQRVCAFWVSQHFDLRGRWLAVGLVGLQWVHTGGQIQVSNVVHPYNQGRANLPFVFRDSDKAVLAYIQERTLYIEDASYLRNLGVNASDCSGSAFEASPERAYGP